MLENAASPLDQTISQPELDRARLYLEQTKSQILGAMRTLSDAQWNFKPGLDRWSIAEIVEHVVFVYERVLGPLQENLANAPVTALDPGRRVVDDIIIYQIPNRLTKFTTPAQAVGDLTRSQALERVHANYARLREKLESTPDLRVRSVESAPLKRVSNGAYDMMDGYQWILAAAAHTERHTKQILEVMADPAFPV